MERNVKVLSEAGFSVRAIVSDNHSSNVNAYSNLSEKFESVSSYYIQHPSNDNNNDNNKRIFKKTRHILFSWQ